MPDRHYAVVVVAVPECHESVASPDDVAVVVSFGADIVHVYDADVIVIVVVIR